MSFTAQKTGDRGTPLQARTGHFAPVENGGSDTRVYKGVMLAPHSKAHFGALHYWVQRAFTRLVKIKKLLRLSGRRTITVSVFIVGGFIQMYCSRRDEKEQGIVSRQNC